MNWVKQVKRRLKGKGPGRSQHQTLGDAARNRGDWATAAIHYQRHLDRKRDDFDIWVQLGHALKESARYDDADNAYQTAQALNSNDADLLLSRGHLAKTAGDLETAIHFYSRSFAVDGNHHARRELPDNGITSVVKNHATFDAPVEQRVVGQIERFSGSSLVGWVVDPDNEPAAAEVELLLNGQVIAIQRADIVRKDVNRAGFSRTPIGFRIDLTAIVDLEAGPWVTARLARTGETLQGGPFQLAPQPEIEAWKNRVLPAPAAIGVSNEIRLSILFQMGGLSARRITSVVSSIQAQTSGDWELVAVSDANTSDAAKTVITNAAKKYPRIKLIQGSKTADPAAALSSGLKASKGQTLLFLAEDAELEPEAAERFIEAASSGATLIYTDEVVIDPKTRDVEAIITRPAFSYDRLLSQPFLGETFAMRTEIARNAAKASAKLNGLSLYALALSATESGGGAAHIPALLVRSISLPSTKADNESLDALNRHLERLGDELTAQIDEDLEVHVVRRKCDQSISTLIVLAIQDVRHLRECLDSLNRLPKPNAFKIVVVDCGVTDPEDQKTLSSLSKIVAVQDYEPGANVATMLNLAVKNAEPSEQILFMSTDLKSDHSDWLSHISNLLIRKDIGAIAPTIVNADGTICDVGFGLGPEGLVDLAATQAPLNLTSGRNPGPGRALLSRRNVSALTLNALLMNREIFNQCGGFEQDLPASLASVDMCLRLGDLGFQILVDPITILRTQGGSAPYPNFSDNGDWRIFANRWRNWSAKGDPFYSPLRTHRGDRQLADLTDMGRSARIRSMSQITRNPTAARMSTFGPANWYHGSPTE